MIAVRTNYDCSSLQLHLTIGEQLFALFESANVGSLVDMVNCFGSIRESGGQLPIYRCIRQPNQGVTDDGPQ